MPRFEGKPERLSPRRAIFCGTHIAIIARLTPSVSRSIGKYGCANAKASFCLRESFYKSIHEICFVLTKQISVSGRACPLRRALKGTPFLYAAKLPAEALAPRGAAPRRGAGLPLQAGLPLRKDVCISDSARIGTGASARSAPLAGGKPPSAAPGGRYAPARARQAGGLYAARQFFFSSRARYSIVSALYARAPVHLGSCSRMGLP